MNTTIATPGTASRALFEAEAEHMAPGLQSIALFSQIAVKEASGVRITDVDGNSYLDFAAGIGVGSVGHCHPHYVRVMTDQVSKAHFGSFCTENRVRFLRTLASITPKGIDSVQMFSSGAEAVEAAMRLAKSATKRSEFVGFWGGFHGKTGGVLGLLGDTSFKKDLGPLMPGVSSLAPYAHCYRCVFRMRHPDCGLACVEFLREAIKRQTCQQLAAIVVEPIQGTAGNVVPPRGFLAAVRQVAAEFGALLIADEMITGFGRTGKMWGVDHDAVVPDIMTLGKGIGGGFPMSAIASTKAITNSLPFANPSGSSSSYGGNPLASAAGRAALDIILNESLVENSLKVGALIQRKLLDLQDRSPHVGDVRGEGLMIGLELVKDKKTKEPLSSKYTRQLFSECLRRGLICMCYSPVIRINPPLVMTEPEAETATDILIEAIAAVSKTVS